MSKIRAGVFGFKQSQYAEHLTDVQVGLNLAWIEIDGHRIDDGVVSLTIEAGPGFQTPKLRLGYGESHEREALAELELIRPVEFVYLGRDGEPLT